jgi:hypothetical protein
MDPVDPRHEARHHPSGGDHWNETFDLRFFAADASVGGYATLTIFPRLGFSWFWACLVGSHRPLVSVVENQAPVPRRGTLELRTSGLWCEVQCETPLEHVTIGMEAFGLALDHPTDALGDARGEPVPLGFDLEWASSVGDVVASDGTSGYEATARVVGEILVGPERIDFDGWGTRRHDWGDTAWRAPQDGCRFTGRLGGRPVRYTASDGVHHREFPARLRSGSLGTDVVGESVAWAPIATSTPEGVTVHIVRGLIRAVRGDEGGAGWLDCAPRSARAREG